MKALILLCMVFMLPNAYACSCIGNPTLEEAIADHDRVLVIKLNKYRNFFFQTKYRLKVVETLKGSENPKLSPIVQGKTSCDPLLKNNQEWLVLLDKQSKDVQLGWCEPHTITEYMNINDPDWKQRIKQ